MNAVRNNITFALLALAPALVIAGQLSAQVPPDAKTEIQDQDLTRRLKDAALEKQAESTLARALRLMNLSRDQLGNQFDPGPTTQEVQKQIINALDEAMKHARAGLSGRPTSAPSTPGDRRQKGKRAQNQQKTADAEQPKPKAAGDPQNAKAGKGSAHTGTIGGDLRETGRQWGNLPPRDREEVVQGLTEEILLKYRRLIEKYYRALAEQADQ